MVDRLRGNTRHVLSPLDHRGEAWGLVSPEALKGMLRWSVVHDALAPPEVSGEPDAHAYPKLPGVSLSTKKGSHDECTLCTEVWLGRREIVARRLLCSCLGPQPLPERPPTSPTEALRCVLVVTQPNHWEYSPDLCAVELCRVLQGLA